MGKWKTSSRFILFTFCFLMNNSFRIYTGTFSIYDGLQHLSCDTQCLLCHTTGLQCCSTGLSTTLQVSHTIQQLTLYCLYHYTTATHCHTITKPHQPLDSNDEKIASFRCHFCCSCDATGLMSFIVVIIMCAVAFKEPIFSYVLNIQS